MKLRTLSLVLGALYALCAVGGPQQMLLMSYRAQVAAAPPAFVQANSVHTSGGVTTQTVVFSGAQSAGDLNVVAVGECSVSNTVKTPTDTEGNSYVVAAPFASSSTGSQIIYYAPNILAAGAGANTVTVTFTGSTTCTDVRVAEYSGIINAAPVDATANGNANTGTAMSSGSASTSNVVDLLVGASYSAGGFTVVGTGYTNRVTSAGLNNIEDKTVNAAGPYSATATQGSSGWWVMQMVAFTGSGGVPPAPPTTLAGLAVSGNHFINSATGATVQLAGAAISGPEGNQGSWTALALVTTSQWSAIAAKYGINMLRFPMNSAYWLNNTVYDDPANPGGGACCYTSSGTNQYTPDPSGTYQSAIQTIVANVTAAGIVADLDLHWDGPKNTSTGNPIAPIGQPGLASGDYAPVFWTQVANDFKNNPLVVFELFNEPFGGANYNDGPCPNCALIGNNASAVPSGYAISMIAGGSFSPYQMQMQKNNNSNALFNLTGCGTACNGAGMEPLITTIRGTGATNVILAAPIWYAGQIQTWLASYTTTTYGGSTTGNPDPLGQLGVSWHQYSWNGGTGPVYNVLSNGYPIVITETQGFDAANDGGTSNNAYPWAVAHNIGVEIWAWATWADGGCSTGTCIYNYMNSTPPWSLNSVPAPAGNTFGQSVITGGSNAPAPAAGVGYTTQTFNSTALGNTTGTWQNFTFFSNSVGAGAAVQNGDGSITLPGTNSGNGYNATLSTAAPHTGSPNNWQGIAFGGGFYACATFKITSGTPSGGVSTPSFWANDIEHMSGDSSYFSTLQWTGQASGYYHWGELDVIEMNVNGGTGYGGAFHDNYGANLSVIPLTGYPTYGGGNGTGTYHKYCALQVPATASTQGSWTEYMDDVRMSTTTPLKWNQFNASNPPPPATGNSTAGAVMDVRHWAFILGDSNSATPMQITGVQVWQASGANNLVH